MKQNQKDESSKQQHDKGTSQKQMPKDQQNGKSAQHGSSDRNNEGDEQKMGKNEPKKHAESGKNR
jgi:hypothetical protein